MKRNQGIAMISLIVTIIVLLILSGILLMGSLKEKDNSQSGIATTELEMVQHAIVERYTKYKLTKNKDLLVGTQIDPPALPDETESWKLTQDKIDSTEKKYYQLNNEDLAQLGLEKEKGTKDIYIVNYYTGEVFNSSKQKTNNGELLYRTIK